MNSARRQPCNKGSSNSLRRATCYCRIQGSTAIPTLFYSGADPQRFRTSKSTSFRLSLRFVKTLVGGKAFAWLILVLLSQTVCGYFHFKFFAVVLGVIITITKNIWREGGSEKQSALLKVVASCGTPD